MIDLSVKLPKWLLAVERSLLRRSRRRRSCLSALHEKVESSKHEFETPRWPRWTFYLLSRERYESGLEDGRLVIR